MPRIKITPTKAQVARTQPRRQLATKPAVKTSNFKKPHSYAGTIHQKKMQRRKTRRAPSYSFARERAFLKASPVQARTSNGGHSLRSLPRVCYAEP